MFFFLFHSFLRPFSSLFFFFFWSHHLKPNFFPKNSNLPFQPTYLPSTTQPIYLPPSHLRSLSPVFFLPSSSQEEVRKRAKGVIELRSNTRGESKFLPSFFFQLVFIEEEDDNTIADAPLSSLMDSTASPKKKIMKGDGARSLARNTTRVEGRA